MRVLLFRGGLALIGLIVPLLLLELAVRLFGPVLPGNYETGVWLTYDSVLGTFHVPGSSAWLRGPEYTVYLRFNSEGLRGPERSPEPPDAPRILLLGDSFVEAKGVAEDQTLAADLRQLVVAPNGRPPEWIAAGVSGWSPVNEYLYLREAGSRLRPDLVILGLYLGNDIADSVPPSRIEQTRLHKPTALAGPSGELQLLPWTVPSLKADEELLLGLGQQLRLARVFQSGVVDKIRYRQPNENMLADPRLVETMRNKETPAIADAYRVLDAELGGIAGETERLGARLLVVLIPSKWQVHREYWDAELAAEGLVDDDSLSLQRPNRRLAGLAAQRGLPLLDLMPALRRLAADGTRAYYPIDIHWTPAGHAVAARTIADYLASSDLLGPGRAAEATGTDVGR